MKKRDLVLTVLEARKPKVEGPVSVRKFLLHGPMVEGGRARKHTHKHREGKGLIACFYQELTPVASAFQVLITSQMSHLCTWLLCWFGLQHMNFGGCIKL